MPLTLLTPPDCFISNNLTNKAFLQSYSDDFCSIYDEDYKSDATEIPHKNLSLKFAWESNADKWNVFVNDVELSALPVAASTDGMNFIVLSAKISLNEKTISEGAREWDKDSL